jgi:hypothetical protein
MSKIEIPEFKSYEEEAAFWDNLDTGDFMEDDGEWFHFDVADERAVRVPILPDTIKSTTSAGARCLNRDSCQRLADRTHARNGCDGMIDSLFAHWPSVVGICDLLVR